MMNHYRIYGVYLDPSVSRPYETAEFVPEGFNLMAFFFAGLWALYHKLWLAGALLVGLNICLNYYGQDMGFGQAALSTIQLGAQLVFGFIGNDLRGRRLLRRGYVLADLAAGASLLQAEQRFYDRHLPVQEQTMYTLANA